MRDELRTSGMAATILEAASSTLSKVTWKGVAIGGAVFAGTLVVNLLLVGVVLLKLPPTYLRDDHARPHAGGEITPARIVRKIGLNLAGLVLVAIGIITS